MGFCGFFLLWLSWYYPCQIWVWRFQKLNNICQLNQMDPLAFFRCMFLVTLPFSLFVCFKVTLFIKTFQRERWNYFWRPGCARVWTCSHISHWETSPWRCQGSRSPFFFRFCKIVSKIFFSEVSKNLSSKTFKTFEFCNLNCKRSERFDCKIAGIFFVLPCIESYQKVDLRTITMGVPPQEVKFTFIVFIHLFPQIPQDSRQEMYITLTLQLCRTCSFYATLEALDLSVGWLVVFSN